jgi:hypothetical protein
MRSALETMPLREILHGNLVRTLEDAEVCLMRLRRECLLLATSVVSDGAVVDQLNRELLCMCALLDHIIITADSFSRGPLKSKVIKESSQLGDELARLRSGLSSIMNSHQPASNPSTNPIDTWIQSALQAQQVPDGDSSTNIENSSLQDTRSSLSIGSATSALGFQARVELHAELKALRQERAALEKAKKEAEIAQKAVQKEREEMRKEAEKIDQGVTKNNEKLKKLQDSVRRLTRKKKPATRALTLQHSDGTTTKLHNVSSVFR